MPDCVNRNGECAPHRCYHPGHQQSDLSRGGEEVEVKTTSITPVCGCEFERETHAVAHSHTTASLLERKPKSVILLRSSQLEFPLLQ